MVSTRSGKNLEAPPAAGPSGASRKRKATEPPPEQQRTPSPPFVAFPPEPDSPSRQLFADLDTDLNPVVRPTNTPALQLLIELREAARAPSALPPPPPPPPSPRHAPFVAGPSLYSPEVSSSSSSSPLSSPAPSPSPSPPRAAFSDLEDSPPRDPTPPDVRENAIEAWVQKKMNEYRESNGIFKDEETKQKVYQILRATAERRRENRHHMTDRERQRQREVDEHRADMEENPRFKKEKRRRKQAARANLMTERDYEVQNLENRIEVTDFAYAPATRSQMLRSDEPVLGRRLLQSTSSAPTSRLDELATLALATAPVEYRVNLAKTAPTLFPRRLGRRPLRILENPWLRWWKRLNVDASRYWCPTFAISGGGRNEAIGH